FVKAGADIVTVHQEACRHLHRTIHLIKEQGAKAGVVLNPATPLVTIESMLDDLDLVLLMTVNPGFGGQAFISNVLAKVAALRGMLDQRGLTHVEIEIDGGVNATTGRLCEEAGASVLVAGNAIFNQPDRAQAIAAIRG
ncbi:ribulose-phosphate 3-epimerase, partial [Frankia sp. Cpl3]|nr:ribulose-phosphate 3-epimerase [Frankia sp. Cpl3]